MGPGNPKLPSHQYSSIAQISKEYAMHTMLKAEIMRKQPQVPNFFEEPSALKSSLSPHYRRAREF